MNYFKIFIIILILIISFNTQFSYASQGSWYITTNVKGAPVYINMASYVKKDFDGVFFNIIYYSKKNNHFILSKIYSNNSFNSKVVESCNLVDYELGKCSITNNYEKPYDLKPITDTSNIYEAAKMALSGTTKFSGTLTYNQVKKFGAKMLEWNLPEPKVVPNSAPGLSKNEKNAVNKALIKSIEEDKKPIDWDLYMKTVQKRIKDNWTPCRENTSSRVVVNFEIGKEGELLFYKITQSSSNEYVDKEAIDSLIKTAPFEPLPRKYAGDFVPIEFTFDYNARQR